MSSARHGYASETGFAQQVFLCCVLSCNFGGKPQHGLYPAGITLSPAQVKRGTELAKERGLENIQFQVRTKAFHLAGVP